MCGKNMQTRALVHYRFVMFAIAANIRTVFTD